MIDERARKLAQYIIDSKDTVRGTAKKFGISKKYFSTFQIYVIVILENKRGRLYIIC